jgi:hypothetical protein
MKKETFGLIGVLVLFGVAVMAAPFTDTDAAKYQGKTGIKALTEVIDANNALIEGGNGVDTTAQSATNNQAITLSTGQVVINGIGGANDSTNTITIAYEASSTVPRIVRLVVNSASTNLITLADSGSVALSAAWIADNNDTLTLMSVGTNWVRRPCYERFLQARATQSN